MKPNILTRERLKSIEDAIDKHGGSVSVRFLLWNHFIQRHIIDEAVAGGYIAFETRKPRTGRPSLIIRKVSRSHPTQLPPSRYSLEDCITPRHWNFAFYYALGECGPGMFSFRRRAYVAYQRSFPSARSKAGAKASASRLLRKPHIQAAIQWSFARQDPELDCRNHHPETTTEIWDTLHALGSWRARRAPYRIQARWR
jgi:hypothetical protein